MHVKFEFPAQDCGKDPATGNPRRYMVLDGPVQYEPPEPRPHVSLHAKKKSLDIPAKILQAGAGTNCIKIGLPGKLILREKGPDREAKVLA